MSATLDYTVPYWRSLLTIRVVPLLCVEGLRFFRYILRMAKPVPLGVSATVEEKVEHQHTLNHHNKALPPIYSTPNMIGLMEQAAFVAMAPFCDPGEISVGTAINIEHRAATGLGATVMAEAVLESQNGRFYVFRVTAHNGEKEIGRGTVTRTFVKAGIDS